FNNQFTPKLGGQFELESGGQFAPELVVNLHWKVVVNLTGFSTLSSKFNKFKDFFKVHNTWKSSPALDSGASEIVLTSLIKSFFKFF
ncbi:hypothetical protein, partial [Flavobacterium taihuense]